MDIVSIFQIEIEKDENIYSNNKTSYKHVLHFLICDSCFWCASCIRLDAPVKCPSCNDNKVEWSSIADRKIQKFDYDLTVGSTGILH